MHTLEILLKIYLSAWFFKAALMISAAPSAAYVSYYVRYGRPKFILYEHTITTALYFIITSFFLWPRLLQTERFKFFFLYRKAYVIRSVIDGYIAQENAA